MSPPAPPSLAHTGSEDMIGFSAASAALLIGGAVLYRRGRATSRR
ncbi:LPXTG cell wall anchor domain-containing protein [Streptomyces sp. ME109]|nr:LPXTG cell wall anchor domain-containing protein [Streptomyces sp. me109]